MAEASEIPPPLSRRRSSVAPNPPPPPRSSVILYAHTSMHALAQSIVKICADHVTCSTNEVIEGNRGQSETQHLVSQVSTGGSPRKVVYREDVQWETFKDGFPKLFINNVKFIAGRDVIFLGSFHSPQSIFEQLSVIYALPRYLARSMIVILPYFPTGTMERIDKEGQIATAKTLATLMSSTPFSSRGPAQMMIFDIHSLQERFYFTDNVIPRLESGVPLLHKALATHPHHDSLAIAFPDEGAVKRFGDMFWEYDIITCGKTRIGDRRIVTVKDGSAAGCRVVIVDDLVQTGGTLIQCAKALLAQGAISVSCYVTHAVFPDKSWEKFTAGPKCEVELDTFWITDSLPHALEITLHKPFKLLSLSHVIADRLLGYDLLT